MSTLPNLLASLMEPFGYAFMQRALLSCALIGFTATCTTSPGAGCTWQFQHTAAHGV